MKKHLFFLLTIISIILATSCSSEQLNSGFDTPSHMVETVTLSFSLELESDDELTKAPGDLGFGNGNKINNLVYALYTQDSSSDPNIEGEIKPVKLKDKMGNYQDLIRIDFNPQETREINIENVEIIKGIEYTLMLWAQYRPEEEKEDDKIYFELENDGIIRIKSYRDNHFPNNDDQRDVFCAVYKIVQYEDTRHLKLILRRPFAQINIGVKEALLKRGGLYDEAGNLLIDKSSIKISGDIANKYNLFKNIAEVEKDEDGETTTYTRTFSPGIIPSKAVDNSSLPLIVKNPDDDDSQEYVWLSMCYILPNGELGNVSKINIDEFKLYDKDDEEIEQLTKKSFFEVPALRNRRTNIILGATDFSLDPWFMQKHEDLTQDKYTSLIELFYNQSNYDDKEYLAKIDESYKDNIILDDDNNKHIMLDDITYTNPYNILPIHRNFSLYGMGEETIIIKDANSGSYHNIGSVRNLVIQDKNGNNKIFIDEDGFIWTYYNGEKEKTSNYLTPLSGGNRSYDITCSTGEVKLSTFYH
ncbi:MAG: hypothetical protein J1E16_09760 [Muribaculaceae bacterium]|nr:hypothetical protein [Muribaculaceae bacterium]